MIHYNKAHNQDQGIPPWVVKVKGETYYVWHFTVEPGVGFSSKETSENPHTKASIKMRGNIKFVENEAKLEAVVYKEDVMTE